MGGGSGPLSPLWICPCYTYTKFQSIITNMFCLFKKILSMQLKTYKIEVVHFRGVRGSDQNPIFFLDGENCLNFTRIQITW